MQDSFTETMSSDEEVSPRKRKRNRKKTTNNYNVNIDAAENCVIGPNSRFVSNVEQRRSFDAARELEDFESFLRNVIAFRGPQKDRIEEFILQELLPYIEDHVNKCRSTSGDFLEVLAKLSSPTLKSPRIAKRALKLLDTFVHVDVGNGVTNAHIFATEKCLRRPIVDGSFKEELTHDQRRRIDVYCNVLLALLIGRAHGHLTYPYNDNDREEIKMCLDEIEKILRRWPLPTKYRRRLSLEIIRSLLQRMLDKKKMLKRLKGLLDACEKMLDGFDERGVDSLLQEIGRVDDGAVDLYVIMKRLHAKVNDQPKAFDTFKAIVTKHELFSLSWHHKKEREHWHFALLACQILVDVTVSHRLKATRQDAARTLASFCQTKAYGQSTVINAITDKYILKAAFAPDICSRKILLENRCGVDGKLPFQLLQKRLCTSNQSGSLEMCNIIFESDDHVIVRGLYAHKPSVVKVIPVDPISSLYTRQDQENSQSEKRFQNSATITKFLNSKSSEHVPVCYAADPAGLPCHMIIEYMMNGDLLGYLRDRRERILPSYREILKICLACAECVEFLHKNRVVHTQLRAENFLVGDTSEHIKITGLSRARVTSDREFKGGFKGECQSPNDEAIRWSDPAGLNDPPVYSFKSDVWAFGVLMYEIITCGNVPYLNEDLQKVRDEILAGRTVSKEQMMKDGYYQLMQCCFGGEDISFKEICIDLRRLISQCDETDDRPIVLPQHVPQTAYGVQATEESCDEYYDLPIYNKDDFRSRLTSAKAPCTLKATLVDDSKHHAQKLTSLSHPHLVKVFKVKKVKNARRISYEHYTGANLRDYIKEHGCTEEDLIRFSSQITSALNYLHSNDIVHCNVTLDNVVVIDEKRVKLSGLQYTRSLKLCYNDNISSSTTCQGQITEYLHRWNAKEVIQEGLFSKASDIWSLGILMWEMFHCLDPDGKDLRPFPQYRDDEILPQLKSGVRPLQPSKCPDWVYIVMTQCWLLHTSERASSLLVLDCLTHRIPWESCLLQNWLTKHKVYENAPNLDIVQINVEKYLSPPQEDVLQSIPEEFAAEHNYEYAQPIWNLKRGFETAMKRALSLFGKSPSSSSPTPEEEGASTSREPQESSWHSHETTSSDLLEVVRPSSRSSSILSVPSSHSSRPNSLFELPLPPLPDRTDPSKPLCRHDKESIQEDKIYDIYECMPVSSSYSSDRIRTESLFEFPLPPVPEITNSRNSNSLLELPWPPLPEKNNPRKAQHQDIATAQLKGQLNTTCDEGLEKNQAEVISENLDEQAHLQDSQECIYCPPPGAESTESINNQLPIYQTCNDCMAEVRERQAISVFAANDLASLEKEEDSNDTRYHTMMDPDGDKFYGYASFYQTPRLVLQNPLEEENLVVVDHVESEKYGYMEKYDDIVVQYFV